MIGMWKQQVIADNPRASDEKPANILNEMVLTQGYDYTIKPEKVRTKTRQPAPKAAKASEPTPSTRPVPALHQFEGALLSNLLTFVGLVGKDGAKD